ncbi:hypothetical protein PanWU01x14_181730, partial [Parasponia andersonii]
HCGADTGVVAPQLTGSWRNKAEVVALIFGAIAPQTWRCSLIKLQPQCQENGAAAPRKWGAVSLHWHCNPIILGLQSRDSFVAAPS